MALIRVRNNETDAITFVGEEWLERWPDDFTPAPEEDPEPTTEDSAPVLSEHKPFGGSTPEMEE